MEALAATAVSIVAPYLAKGAEEFAREVGQQAAGAVRAVCDRLRRWWSRNPAAKATADDMPSHPKTNARALGLMLAAALEEDPAFAEELRALVGGVGPSIEVVQRIEVGEGVTGADIESLVRGDVHVTQDMRSAKDVTGYRGNSVGARPVTDPEG